MNKIIYIVEGSVGEHADYRTWPVAAYYSEKKAKKHVDAAVQRANELYMKFGPAKYYDIPAGANQYDQQMKTDYTGTRYNYYAVEILDKGTL